MRIAVLGATGYIGGRLVPALVEAGHEVVCVARDPRRLDDRPWRDRVKVVRGDVLERPTLDDAFAGADAVYHLVHSMGHARDFATTDRLAAEHVRDAAAAQEVEHVIYLGGLGDDDDPTLSHHLSSRHEVGRVLAGGSVPVTELRAAIIIGSGSASFEMLRSLVEVLPVMVVPRWVHGTRCQPVGIRDVLAFLVGALDHPPERSQVLDLGGPDVLTYRELMDIYASVAGLRRRVILPVPFLTPRLSSHWVNVVTPLPFGLARPLIESQVNDVVVRAGHDARQVIPHQPMPMREAIGSAIRRVQDLDVRSSWSDAEGTRPADPTAGDPDWSGGTLLADDRRARTADDPATVFARLEVVGGDTGWYVGDALWRLRGFLDELVGGVGMRRGRRDPVHLRVGDAVDFFRVESVVPGELLRLRVEMKVPGSAWLEWQLEPDGDPSNPGTRVRQRAIMYPRGIVGRLYWWSLVPFHAVIFRRLLDRVAHGSG